LMPISMNSLRYLLLCIRRNSLRWCLIISRNKILNIRHMEQAALVPNHLVVFIHTYTAAHGL
jgi:hypothetical protein